jgi:hypothetical protein
VGRLMHRRRPRADVCTRAVARPPEVRRARVLRPAPGRRARTTEPPAKYPTFGTPVLRLCRRRRGGVCRLCGADAGAWQVRAALHSGRVPELPNSAHEQVQSILRRAAARLLSVRLAGGGDQSDALEPAAREDVDATQDRADQRSLFVKRKRVPIRRGVDRHPDTGDAL